MPVVYAYKFQFLTVGVLQLLLRGMLKYIIQNASLWWNGHSKLEATYATYTLFQSGFVSQWWQKIDHPNKSPACWSADSEWDYTRGKNERGCDRKVTKLALSSFLSKLFQSAEPPGRERRTGTLSTALLPRRESSANNKLYDLVWIFIGHHVSRVNCHPHEVLFPWNRLHYVFRFSVTAFTLCWQIRLGRVARGRCGAVVLAFSRFLTTNT